MENHDSDRILLIDDDPMVRLLAELNLQRGDLAAPLASGEDRSFGGASPRLGDISDPRD